jgi:eukaryotic-like serine/threonine-protein kinase
MICPLCHRAFDDPAATFCGEDGALLVDTPPIKRAEPKISGETGAVLSGRYQIQGLIGRGGVARVYLAVDTTTGAEVAVKILDRDKVTSRVMRDRFLREVEIAARIGHPNIARILDAGERPDRAPYIVLEYLTGESVGDLLHREGRVSEDFALALAKRAAAALVAAHAEGVIHRDIKPDNLFLVDDGSVLKVLDFGMAKLQDGAFTAVGTAIGTVPYMAPEQTMGDRVDGRADVYGLGITLFKMLTGALPFDTRDDATLVAHHLYTPMPRPSALLPGIDPRIERLILAATRKLPDNRYPSMRELLEDVGRILGERSGDIAAPEARIAPDVYTPENPMFRTIARQLRGLVS